MDFVVYQMMQLQHVDVANCHLPLEHFTTAPVGQIDLPGRVEAGLGQHSLDVTLPSAIEHGGGNGNALLEVIAQLQKLIVAQRLDLLGKLLRPVDILQPVQ